MATILGTTGNDFLTNPAGNDQINGGTGTDTAVFSGPLTSATITRTGNITTVVSSDGTDVLTDVERLQFSDQTVAFDTDGTAGQAYRIYKAAFARTPDNDGLKFWIVEMDKGTSLLDVSKGFVASEEYKTVYGTNPTPLEIVQKFYQNVLGRDGEDGGITFWVGEITSGNRTIEHVLAGFSESPENIEGVAPSIINGIKLTGTLISTTELTAGADTTTGGTGADTFSATQATLGVGDVINGGLGPDVFNYTSSGTGPVVHSGFALKNIETVNVTSNATGGTTIDLSGSTGINTIGLKPSSSDITINGLGLPPTLDLSSLGSNFGELIVEDSHTLVISSASGTASAVNSAVSGVAQRASQGGDSFAMHLANTEHGPSHPNVSLINVGLIIGAINATIDIVDAPAMSLIDVSEHTGTLAMKKIISIDQDFTLNASGTGNVSATFASTTTASSNINVIGGSGSQAITFEGVGFNAGDKFDGGAGVDSIIVEAGDFSSPAKYAPLQSVKNTEILSFIGSAYNLIDYYHFSEVSDANPRTIFDIIQHNGSGDFEVVSARSDTVFDFGTLSSGTTTAARFFGLDILNLSLTGSATEDADVLSLDTSLDYLTVNLVSTGGTTSTSNDIGTWINQAGATLSISGSGNTGILGMTNAGTIDGTTITGRLTLVGSTGNDTLKSGSGNDSFQGNAGSDTIIFGINFGQDTVQDFAAGIDKIVFNSAAFANFADMQSNASQSGSSVVIQNGTNSVTLMGISLADLNAGDFQFV